MNKYTLLVLLSSTLAMTACKDSSKAAPAAHDHKAPAAAPAAAPKAAAPAAADVTEVSIDGTDAMSFSQKTIKVPAGKKVKLTLHHTGKMAKEVMGHNWILLKAGVDGQAFANGAVAASATDYIPADKAGDIIAHTKLLGGGESDTITFDAPEKGTYTFLCSFPGHYAIMHGEFIVE